MKSQQQFDYNHATDSQYTALRAQAQESMNMYQKLSQQSQNAYKQGEKSEAKKLSESAKQYRMQASRINEDAANYVFQQNNLDSSQEELDLHGLFVDEAEWIMKRRIYVAVRSNEPIIKVIVGKGLHSEGHKAKLKPAMEDICEQYNLKHYLQSGNSGVMCISLENVQLQSLPAEWSTMDYTTYLELKKNSKSNISRPQTNHQAGQYNGPQYSQQQNNNNSPNYSQQQNNYNNQSHYSQQQASNGNQNTDCSVVMQILKVVISCLK